VAEEGDILGDSSFVVLEPTKWIGKKLPLLKHIDIGDQLKSGKWIVVLYDHTCSHCMDAIPKYRQHADQLAAQSDSPRIALIEIPPYDGMSQVAMENPPSIHSGKLGTDREWFVQAPVEMMVEDGKVVFAAEHGEGLEWLSKFNNADH
jgi:hypothetical protein